MTKTRLKTVATLEVGEFKAHETVLCCETCDRQLYSEELRRRVPSYCKFGFDVIEYVGIAVFVRCRNERDVQHELHAKNIPISLREISYLCQKFIVYLALAHKESQRGIKKILLSKGGYILHLDSTVEGDSPHLMTALDEVSEIVLDNIKLSSEKAELIVPFLKPVKKAFGTPLAIVRDMGKGIGSAVAQVFPDVKDFLCHYHFLRDIGRDLFGQEYDALRNGLKKHTLTSSLRKLAKQLKRKIDKDAELSSCLESYLTTNKEGVPSEKLLPAVMAYTLTLWVLDAKRQCKGHGFPFDRAYLYYYQRMRAVKEVLAKQKLLGSKETQLAQLKKIINRVLADRTLARAYDKMIEKTEFFDRLRQAMRITVADDSDDKSLNDNGDDVDIKTIEQAVTVFRNNKRLIELAENQRSYKKMLEQLDTYWDKLFADPITVSTKQGSLVIQPQRTNNILERFFRDIKRDYRKKTGNKSLSRTLRALLADMPLVKNLAHQEYRDILLKGKNSLAERFAQIDDALVRKTLAEQQNNPQRIPPSLKKALKFPDLPQKLFKTADSHLAA